jgi:FkbH-like protein
MPETFAALPWLADAPADFLARCRALPNDAPGQEIARLASFRLSSQQSLVLSRAIARCRAQGAELKPLSPFRLAVLTNSTFDLVADGLPAAAARHAVALEVTSSAYDQIVQQVLDPDSNVNRSQPDAVLVAVDHRWLDIDYPRLDSSAATSAVEDAVRKLHLVVDSITTVARSTAILQTVPVPPLSLLGSFDRRIPGSIRSMLDQLNDRIAGLCNEPGSYLLDAAAMAERVGTDTWFDPGQWAACKLPFSSGLFPAYAELLGRLLGAIRGKSRKCLVIDLDNTIWGGAIGDEGLEGIVIGQGSALGESFLSVQKAAIELRQRGIVLAVCSKNDHEVAIRAFREHPDMLLREEHMAVFQANWESKAANLEAIAQHLNLGLDSLVFLDDNPVERAQIRAALPMVAVPELPPDPSRIPWYISAAGYFEAVSFSNEDAKRAESYASDARRLAVKETTRDLGDYLSSLSMKIGFAPFDALGRQRIVQLINKTNQFNLTTRRYTEAEVKTLEADNSAYTLQVRLQDAFGDLGMIGVVICIAADDAVWEIDSWLMSCRVLGRRVEEAVLAQIVREAGLRNIRQIVGIYIPTDRNHIVEAHYPKLGFKPIEAGAEHTAAKRFALPVDSYVEPALPFSVLVQEMREPGSKAA